MTNAEIIAKADEGYEGIFNAHGAKHLSTDEAIRYGAAKVSFAIVRCRDCKSNKKFDVDEKMTDVCRLMMREVNPDFFCADGERSE